MPVISRTEWTEFLAGHPRSHLLQTASWGELKASFGWSVKRLVVDDSGAQILFRDLPLGMTFAYIPKGPIGPSWEGLWREIDAICRHQGAAFLKVEPDLWLDPDRTLPPAWPPANFRQSSHAIQPPRTLVVSIGIEEDLILARMRQKTRYNIRLARRKGVIVRPSADVGLFHRLLDLTARRDQFGVHSLAYYQKAYDLFHPSGGCEIFVAEFQGEPLAAIMVFAHGARTWYLYGASSVQHRNRMPNHLLQWEAIRWARANGCVEYDLWGVPDQEEAVLEAQFARRTDGLWGVYRFKRGFGGKLTRSVGPWDRVYRPLPYALYRWWMNRTSGR